MPETPKVEIRKAMREKRDRLNRDRRDGQERSEAIKQRLFALEEVQRAECVAFYIATGSEVETKAMIDEALARGKRVLVPVTEEEIFLVEFTGWENLKPGEFGILEPQPGARSRMVEGRDALASTIYPMPSTPAVIIVPGLAFDWHGHRVGYGKGYYDRLLKKISAVRIGICFDFQVVERIPATKKDERMDFIITEKKVLKIEQ